MDASSARGRIQTVVFHLQGAASNKQFTTEKNDNRIEERYSNVQKIDVNRLTADSTTNSSYFCSHF